MSSPNDLPCRDVVEWATEYLEQTMAPLERARVEQHLLICAPCQEYLAQMRETARLAGTLVSPPSPEAKEKLVSIFREWRARGAKR